MKNKVLYLCFLVLLSTSCNEQSFDPDDIMLQCYDSKYQEEGYDIKTVIEDYEKVLVAEGILRDGSGSSYLEVYQIIVSDKGFRIHAPTFQQYDPMLKVEKQIAFAVFECESEMIELAKEKDSKWQKLQGHFDSQEIKENPDLHYQNMVEAFTANELNSYYFRLKMFHIFDMVNTEMRNQSSMPRDPTD